ncbi:unnamed protein product [Durusdinium trenchii]|uniref:Uncharacterized protein n=2 Tax=Durusdinium trenchii TaxID=1381693 RepID=A0ABP0MPZ2_9DINO
MAFALLVFLSLLVATTRAGSGCNEAADDPGPWVSQLDIEKTEEGFELQLHLVGGDVAASSTESVELTLSTKDKRKSFVLMKHNALKGGILEIRTEEDLLSGQAFFVQATLAEYNGNSHGPETLACQVRPQEPHRYSCLRVAEPKKASEGPLPSASSGGQDQQMQMQGMHHGTAGSGHEHPMHQGEHMQGMHGMHGTKGMHGSGMRGSTSMRGTAAPTASMMGAQQAPMAALPLSLGAVCTPGFGNCPAGSECKVYRREFTCQRPVASTVAKGSRMVLVGGLVLFVFLGVVAWLFRQLRVRSGRSFGSLPKVVGKANMDLSTMRPKGPAYQEASDSDEDYRVF